MHVLFYLNGEKFKNLTLVMVLYEECSMNVINEFRNTF